MKQPISLSWTRSPPHPAMSAAAPIRALSIHANYGCRDSGACCTAGWRIPVEPATEHAVTSLIAAGALTRENDDPFERQEGLTVTALAADGACVFFERGSSMTPHRCAIHRVAGHDAKPLACRQFPRVSLQDARGISVSLSHFCPTAAELLFGPGVPLEIVEAPPAFPSTGDYDGLNAMDALPPLVAPGMLMDLEAYDAWERHMVAVLVTIVICDCSARPACIGCGAPSCLEAVSRAVGRRHGAARGGHAKGSRRRAQSSRRAACGGSCCVCTREPSDRRARDSSRSSA